MSRSASPGPSKASAFPERLSASDRLAAFNAMLARCEEAQSRTGRRLVFGWVTALVLHGVDLPRYHDLPGSMLYAIAASDAARVQLQGVRSFVWAHPFGTESIGNVTCVDAVTAFMQMMRFVDGHDEAVVLGDALLRRSHPIAPAFLADADAFLLEAGRFKGRANAKWALPRIVAGTDSPMESRLRVEMVRSGLPRPVVNHAVWDDETMRRYFIDLAIPELRIAVEYMGKEWHGMSGDADSERILALQRMGWVVVIVTAARMSSVAERRRLMASLRSVVAQRRRELGRNNG